MVCCHGTTTQVPCRQEKAYLLVPTKFIHHSAPHLNFNTCTEKKWELQSPLDFTTTVFKLLSTADSRNHPRPSCGARKVRKEIRTGFDRLSAWYINDIRGIYITPYRGIGRTELSYRMWRLLSYSECMAGPCWPLRVCTTLTTRGRGPFETQVAETLLLSQQLE